MTAIFVFLLFISDGTQGQTAQTHVDQNKLMLKFLGKWQANVGKDTVEVWECLQFGKAFTIDVYRVIKDKKTLREKNNIRYSPEEDKFKGFDLYNDATYDTWIGSFTSEKKFEGTAVRDFNPEPAYEKFQEHRSEMLHPLQYLHSNIYLNASWKE